MGVLALAFTGCAAQRADAVGRVAVVDDALASPRAVLVGGPGDTGSAAWATPGARASGVRRTPVNATCPVWVGHTVDASVTDEWQGAVVAFKDADARRAWMADPARYAAHLPRLSGSGGDGVPSTKPVPTAPRATLGTPDVPVASATELPPAVRRRPASAARVVPPAPARIGSPDAVVRAEPAPSVRGRASAVSSPPSVPPARMLGSPDGAARPMVRPASPVARPALPVARPATAPPAPAVRTAPPSVVAPPVVAPPCDEDDEECPGGVCRVPGM